MNYKDTILKNVQWKPHVKQILDDQNNLNITIKIDNVLDLQAKASFTLGLSEMLEFLISRDKSGNFDEQVTAKMKEWGLK